MNPIHAWHFVADTLRDGSPIPPDGKKLKYDGPLKLCHTGLHANIDPYDALLYAPGDTLCLVQCGGEIIHDTDKLVCSERTIVARMDASEMLRYFARMMALSVVHLYPNDTDDVVFEWLMTGEESIRVAAGTAARAAEWAAEWAVAGYAARAVAGAAARAVAGAAEWEAARAAAWAAEWAAEWAVAGAAARAVAGAAEWEAARAAAWAVAGYAARADFNGFVSECFEDFLP